MISQGASRQFGGTGQEDKFYLSSEQVFSDSYTPSTGFVPYLLPKRSSRPLRLGRAEGAEGAGHQVRPLSRPT